MTYLDSFKLKFMRWRFIQCKECESGIDPQLYDEVPFEDIDALIDSDADAFDCPGCGTPINLHWTDRAMETPGAFMKKGYDSTVISPQGRE